MFIGTDKISEIVNHSDSDGSCFGEISDSDTCTVEYILITRNKKIIFDNHTHKRVTQVISAGLLEFASICSFCSNVLGRPIFRYFTPLGPRKFCEICSYSASAPSSASSVVTRKLGTNIVF
jgi:hypothetical protein